MLVFGCVKFMLRYELVVNYPCAYRCAVSDCRSHGVASSLLAIF